MIRRLGVSVSYSVLPACLLLLIVNPICVDAKVILSVESPRRAFYRGEQILLVVKCVNTGDEAVTDATLNVELAGCVRDAATLGQLPAGKERRLSFRLPTAGIKSGRYELTC